MNKRFSVGAAVSVLLGSTLLFCPESVADSGAPSDPADTWPAPHTSTLATGSVPATSTTPAMRQEISRVVGAGEQAARVAPSAGARQLASTEIRCASFEEQRYCLHYGWTERTPRELRSDLIQRDESARTTGGVESGDESLVDAMRQRARLAPDAQAAADRRELEAAAQATAKVIALRNDLEGTPYPKGFFARHPEVSRASLSTSRRASKYPSRKYIMNWHHVREQRQSYWCGPGTMQMIAWGWQKEVKPQRLWANRMGTTTSGTSIYSMTDAVNKYTGYDKEKYAGKYIVLDISGYSFHQWLRLNKRHYAKYEAPIVMHPVLDARYFDYLKGYSGSGHFQVGRGYNNRGNSPSTIGLFEPYNPRRFNSSAPYVARLQYHRAYMSYQANQAHPQQNIGV